MEPLSVGMTDMVAGAGGAGFAMPRIRLNAGVSANTQTPESRAATMEGMLGGLDDSNLVLDPISELRDEFDNGVANLYSWVAESIQQGIDPRYYDPSNPESPKRYRAFIEEKQRLRRMRDDLVTTKELRKENKFVVPTNAKDAKDAVSRMVMPEFAKAVQEYNAGVTASGYAEGTSFELALQNYERASGDLLGVYQQMLSQVGDDEAARQAITNNYKTAVAGMQRPNLRDMTEYQQAMLGLRQAELELRRQQIENGDETPILIDAVPNTRITIKTKDGGSPTQASMYTKNSVNLPVVDLPVANAYIVEDSKVSGKSMSKGTAKKAKVGRLETLPVDKNGRPILEDIVYEGGTEVAGFAVFGIGVDEDDNIVYVDGGLVPNSLDKSMRKPMVGYYQKMQKDASTQSKQVKKSANPTATAPSGTPAPAQTREFKGVPQGGF